MPALYVWNVAGDRRKRMESLCARLRIPLVRVSPAQARLPLGRLAAPAAAASPAAMPFPEEMLLMKGFPERLMDAFLAGLREEGLAPIPLKAVLTPSNAGWDSVKLHDELLREARSFGAL